MEQEKNKQKVDRTHNYTVYDVQDGIRRLDVDAQAIIYCNYKMNDILQILNDDIIYYKNANFLSNMSDKYRKLHNGLFNLRKILSKGQEKITDEEITQVIIKSYTDLPEEKQTDICKSLGLLKVEDTAKQEETVTMDKIIHAYEGMSVEERLKLDSELRNRDTFSVSCQRAKKSWEELKAKLAHMGCGNTK